MVIFIKRIIFIVLLGFYIILFSNVKINAYNPSSYIMMDVDSQRVLKQNNENSKSLIASTVKILTCLVVIKNAELYEYITITKNDINVEGSRIYLEEGDSIQIIDLLYGLMLRSGNDAAMALANNVFSSYDRFIIEMNEEAKRIKMTSSSFSNPTGLDSDTKNYSTAYDMALLMIEAMKHDVFKMVTNTTSYKALTIKNEYYWKNKHRLIVSDKRFIGGKTGYTKASGRILVSYVRLKERDIVIVTINNSNDWNFHQELIRNMPNYHNKIILKSGNYEEGIIMDNDVFVPLTYDEKITTIVFLKSNNELYILGYDNDKILYKRKI